MQWCLSSNQIPETESDLMDVLFTNRAINDRESFLVPKNPLDLTLAEVGINKVQVEGVVSRIKEAKTKQEKIVIFGDYDCDGVCATAVLWECLHKIGCKVLPFIPNRERHGYGLSAAALDEILATGKPDVLISVDNGIVAHAPWQRLKDLGVTTILTDHHEPELTLPNVDFIIHTTKLCGTTVAWMLAKALNCLDGLDLCAIATVADQMPLLDAHRSFVTHGLAALNGTTRPGLVALLTAAGLRVGELDVSAINYGIAPRLNAAGRLDDALDALRALCARRKERAELFIHKLMEINIVRQDMTAQMVERAMRQAESWRDEKIIVVGDTSFHEGVIGLIASKLTETFHKPSVVLATGGKSAKGSARSVKGVHITMLLRTVRETLMEVGGHPMAAGLRVANEKLEIFQDALRIAAREAIDVSLLTPQLMVDCAIPQSLMALPLVKKLQSLEPCGTGNPKPSFVFPHMRLLAAKTIGKEDKHLKLSLGLPNGQQIDALWFGHGDALPTLTIGSAVDCAGRLDINSWHGRETLQILLHDIQTN